MTRRLILTGFLLCGLLYVGVAEARVCALGDEGCSYYGVEGPDEGKCSSDYKKCDDPRAGATYCGHKGSDGKVEALYKAEDCCSTLSYKECPEEDNEIGYGKSCQGAKSHTKFWEFCGCSFGFVDTAPDAGGSLVNSIDGLIVDDDNHETPYDTRCSVEESSGDKCKLAVCNTARRWFHKKSGEHCLYRSTAKCGGIVCSQLYDCDNDNDYYRTEDLFLEDSKHNKYDNYIGFEFRDPWSNEKDWDNWDKATYITGQGGDTEYKGYRPTGELPYGKKLVGDNSPSVAGTENRISYTDVSKSTFSYGDYRVTNRLVCGYLRHNGKGPGDTSGGLECNGLVNYCYKWTGCNTARGWFNFAPNIGVLYGEVGQTYEDYTLGGMGAYEHWMNEVERSSIYKSIYSDMANISPATALGEGFDLDPQKNELRQNFLNVARVRNGVLAGCDGNLCENYGKGCTYVTHSCHKGSHECYKRIGCSEENRFYHSFINAAAEAFDSQGLALTLDPVDRNGTTLNTLYNSSLNGIYWADFYKANEDGLSGLDPREIYPACKYEINACNDTINEGKYGGGCYRKHGCIDNFEDIHDHLTIEEDWLDWFKDWRPICNDNTRCYQASACDLPGGSYSSEPNTSFFITIHSTATMSTCYRGANCNFDAGSYSSLPNSSYFHVIESAATGSTCYRGENCNWDEGAYSSEPNTSFFMTSDSIATGSQCYRGEGCRENAGVYESEPNTLFFKTISSEATGTTCYRGEDCVYDDGAYSSEPNTSFFKTIASEASSSICYRGEDCFYDGGAYSATPNTLFFKTIASEATSTTCYRGEECSYDIGAYSSTPNADFFKVIDSQASGSVCYRAQCCTPPNCELEKPDTSFFYAIYSEASDFHGDVACYRAPGCHQEAGAYVDTPNVSFFETASNRFGEACRNARGVCPGFDPADTSICYRGTSCNIKVGAYSSEPNTSFFITADSLASGSQCYRGIECHVAFGAYSSTPNTSFFYSPIKSLASGSECYRKNDRTNGGLACNTDAGSYPIEQGEITLNTSYFYTIESLASGTTCYRASRCHTEVGAYEDSPNTSFFYLVDSLQSWVSVCYRAHHCHDAAGAREGVACTSSDDKSECFTKKGGFCTSDSGCVKNKDINPRFFKVVYSLASGSTCYRGDRCNTAGGAYRTSPNTKFFITINSVSLPPVGTKCFRGQECNLAVGAYTSAPNKRFFTNINSFASGSTCYRVKDCVEPDKANDGPCKSYPDTAYFNVEYSSIAGYTCAIATGCKAYNFTSGTSGGELFVWNWDTWDGVTCPYIVKPAQGFDDVNYCIFNRAAVPGPDDHTTFESGSAQEDYGQWKFTKGKSTDVDPNRQPQCTQKYDNSGTISVDECGQEMETSGTSVTAYYPLGCNVDNGWEANKQEKFNSCYFKATSITKHFIVNINQSGENNVSEFLRLEDFKAGEKNLTCYKYTEPKMTQNSFESCIYEFQEVESTNHPAGAPSAVGGTSNEMLQSCSDSTKGTKLTGYGLQCGDNNNVLKAYYPNGCDASHGWFETLVNEDINASTDITDKVNDRYFAKRYISTSNVFNGQTCYDQACYKATKPLCTAPSNVFKVVTIRATGGDDSCSADTLEATYATECNIEKGFYPKVGHDENAGALIDDETLNASYFYVGTAKINTGDNCGYSGVTCYYAMSCAQDSHPNWCYIQRIENNSVPCYIDTACKESANTQYFTVVSADCRAEEPITCNGVATGALCEKGDEIAFTWASTSTTENTQRYEDKVYTATYPSGCKTSNGYYPTSLTSTCDTSYFKFDPVQTAEGCGHSHSCQRYLECAQNPDTCYVVPTTVTCGNSGTFIANCSIAQSCKTSPNTSYFQVNDIYMSYLSTSCSSAVGVRPECTQTNTDIFTHSVVQSIDCNSEFATQGAYTAWTPVNCNSNNHYYPQSVATSLGAYYDFGPEITKEGCGAENPMTCQLFKGCKNNDTPNTCFLELDYSSYLYEEANSTTWYCKYDCKDFDTDDAKYFTSTQATSRGITCTVANGAKCSAYDKAMTPNSSMYYWSSASVDCNSGKATLGSYTSHYITGCNDSYYNTSIFEYDTIGYSDVSSECNPDGVYCYKATGCADGWTQGSCGAGWFAATSSTDPKTGITCSQCVKEWFIDNLVVYLKSEHKVVTSGDQKKEKSIIKGATYVARLKNAKTENITGTPYITKIVTSDDLDTDIDLELITPYNEGTPPIWGGNKCSLSGSCTVSGEPRTVCGPQNISDEDIIAGNYKCELDLCTAQVKNNGGVWVSATLVGGVETDPKEFEKGQYIECVLEEEDKTCSDYGLSNTPVSGMDCTEIDVEATDGPCYFCKELDPECSDLGDDWVDKDEYGTPDSEWFNYTSTTLSNNKVCYQIQGCKQGTTDTAPYCSNSTMQIACSPDYGGTNYGCCMATGCKSPYVDVNNNGCIKGVNDSGQCEYNGVTCGLCNGTCSELGDGWVENVPTNRQKFFFEYDTSSIDGTDCYKATGCNHGAVANAIGDSCYASMSGLTCGILAPDHLDINKSSYSWKLGTDEVATNWFKTREMTVDSISGYTAKEKISINNITSAKIGCSTMNLADNFIAISKSSDTGNLKDWTIKEGADDCPITTQEAIFTSNNEEEIWGNKDNVDNKFWYYTEFLVDGGSICTINKDVCLNGCKCVPSCDDIGMLKDEPSGQTCEEYAYSACGQTITCYQNCSGIYFPRQTILETTFIKSNFVCETNKLAYPIGEQEAYYRHENLSRTNFDQVTYDGGDGVYSIESGAVHGAYDKYYFESGKTIYCSIKLDDGTSYKAGSYKLYTKQGEIGKSGIYDKSDTAALCIDMTDEGEYAVAHKLKIRFGYDFNQNYEFETYPLDTAGNLCYNGVCKSYVSDTVGGLAGFDNVQGYPMTFIGTSQVTTKDGDKTYTFNAGDECQFWESKGQIVEAGSAKDGTVNDVKTGQFLYNVPENMSDFYNYTYLHPCYAEFECRSDGVNPFYKLEKAIEKSCNTENTQKIFKKFKNMYSFTSMAVLDKSCEIVNGCNASRGCKTEDEMEAEGWNISAYDWSYSYEGSGDVASELDDSCTTPSGEFNKALIDAQGQFLCFCPIEGSCKSSNYEASEDDVNSICLMPLEEGEGYQPDKGYVYGAEIGGKKCYSCLKCSDIPGFSSSHEGYDGWTELKDDKVMVGAEKITCYKDLKKCSDYTRYDEYTTYQYTNADGVEAAENLGFTCNKAESKDVGGLESCYLCWKPKIDYFVFGVDLYLRKSTSGTHYGNFTPDDIVFTLKNDGAMINGQNYATIGAKLPKDWHIMVDIRRWYDNAILKTIGGTCYKTTSGSTITYGAYECFDGYANNLGQNESGQPTLIPVDKCTIDQEQTETIKVTTDLVPGVEFPAKVERCGGQGSCKVCGAYSVNDPDDMNALNTIKDDNGCEETDGCECTYQITCGSTSGCMTCPKCSDYGDPAFYSESAKEEQIALGNKDMSKVDPEYVGQLTKCYGRCSTFNKDGKEYLLKDECQAKANNMGTCSASPVPAEQVGGLTECYEYTKKCSDFNTAEVTYYDATEIGAQQEAGKTCVPTNSENVGGLTCYTCSVAENTIDNLKITVYNTAKTENSYDKTFVTGISYKVLVKDKNGNVTEVAPDSIEVNGAQAEYFRVLADMKWNNSDNGQYTGYATECNIIGRCTLEYEGWGYTAEEFPNGDEICTTEPTEWWSQESCPILKGCTAKISNLQLNPFTIKVAGAEAKTFAKDEAIACEVYGTDERIEETKCSDFNTEDTEYLTYEECETLRANNNGGACNLVSPEDVGGLTECYEYTIKCSDFNTNYVDEEEKTKKEIDGYECEAIEPTEVDGLKCYECIKPEEPEDISLSLRMCSTKANLNNNEAKAYITKLSYFAKIGNGTPIDNITLVSPDPFTIEGRPVITGEEQDMHGQISCTTGGKCSKSNLPFEVCAKFEGTGDDAVEACTLDGCNAWIRGTQNVEITINENGETTTKTFNKNTKIGCEVVEGGCEASCEDMGLKENASDCATGTIPVPVDTSMGSCYECTIEKTIEGLKVIVSDVAKTDDELPIDYTEITGITYKVLVKDKDGHVTEVTPDEIEVDGNPNSTFAVRTGLSWPVGAPYWYTPDCAKDGSCQYSGDEYPYKICSTTEDNKPCPPLKSCTATIWEKDATIYVAGAEAKTFAKNEAVTCVVDSTDNRTMPVMDINVDISGGKLIAGCADKSQDGWSLTGIDKVLFGFNLVGGVHNGSDDFDCGAVGSVVINCKHEQTEITTLSSGCNSSNTTALAIGASCSDGTNYTTHDGILYCGEISRAKINVIEGNSGGGSSGGGNSGNNDGCNDGEVKSYYYDPPGSNTFKTKCIAASSTSCPQQGDLCAKSNNSITTFAPDYENCSCVVVYHQ